MSGSPSASTGGGDPGGLDPAAASAAGPGRGAIDRVCVVGAGGREHALAVVLGRTADVVVTPGNPGIRGRTADGHTIISSRTPAEEVEADLYVIGPEAPLVDGLADRLRAAGGLVFGPGADGARLEGSKAFMKELLSEAGVPTARYGAFDDPAPAKAYLRSLPGPWVVKTDGLAAGKGVLVTDSRAEAEADIDAKLSGDAFGDAGRRVVVEEGMTGPECSLLVLCDGRRLAALAPARDFKRLRDHDQGPNTGGMGAYSPVPSVDGALVTRLVDEAVAPLVAALRARGIDYRGVLYAGVMLTADGPKVLEFNVRFGDPETQVVLPRLQGDLAGLLAEAAAGSLVSVPRFADTAAVCVVLASAGYPESPRTGDPIAGLDRAAAVDGVTVFHAGTARAAAADPPGPTAGPTGEPGAIVTAGGRVLGVTALGETIAAARDRAYRGVSAISWPGMQARSDIGSADGAVGIGAGGTGAGGTGERQGASC
ncbi:MAG TPA: phosphoribosylamine--glycine ligase [Acidimicrobiales bacterium]